MSYEFKDVNITEIIKEIKRIHKAIELGLIEE